MMELKKFTYTAVAAALVAPGFATAAVEEITVSAQRRDASLQEVPISVTALSDQDMQRLQINLVADIAKNVPNLQTYTVTAGAAAMQVFMRGAGVQNPGFNSSEAPVGIYIDDVYRGRVGTANLDLTDIERIEVLRGPQGTLYGRNSLAGAIKVITRTPGEETYGNASFSVGNYDTRKMTGAIGGQVADGVGMSISGLYSKRSDGWIDRGSVGGRSLGEYENKAVRGKLNLFGDDLFKAVVSMEYVDAENDGYNAIPYGPFVNPPGGPSSPGQPVEGFYDSLVPDSQIGFGETKQANAALDMSWTFDALTFRSITSYSHIEDRFKFDLNGGVFEPANGVLIPGAGGLYVKSNSENDTFTQEFSFSGESDSFDWIAGVFYMKESGEQDYVVDIVTPALGEYSDTDTTSYAIFGEGTWTITEKFSLTAGMRWTLDDKDYTNDCGASFFLCGGGWTNELGDNFNEFTPRLLVQYQLTEDTMLFAGVSRGFQSGGFQGLCFGNLECNSVIYEPQTVVSWEAGVKSDMADGKLRVNASTFFAQYSDLQQTAIGDGGFPVQNVGSADVFGLELETLYSPIEGLDLWAVAGYADDDISQSALDNLSPTTEVLPGLPEFTIRAGFDYRRQISSELNLLFGLDVNHADDYYATINNVLEIDSYTRYNGRIGFEDLDGKWSIILSGTNLGDDEDLYSGIAGNGTNIRTPQPPREYMLNVNFNY